MGSHGARTGNDEIWERVRAGDVELVNSHMSEAKRKKRSNLQLRQSSQSMEMWHDESLNHGRRRRQSVSALVSGMVTDTESPMHQQDMDSMNALRGLTAPSDYVSVEERVAMQQEISMNIDLGNNTNTNTNIKGAPETATTNTTTKPNNRLAVGSLFDHIFVRPMAPRETCLKYEKYEHYLPLLRVTESAHGRGETNVATHMRNATVLTKSYQKYRSIDPNQLLNSYKDKIKLRKLAEHFLEEDPSSPTTLGQSPDSKPGSKPGSGSGKNSPVGSPSSSRKLTRTISRTLKSLEGNTFSLSGPEKYLCFHSKFKESKGKKRRKKRKKKKIKKKKELRVYAKINDNKMTKQHNTIQNLDFEYEIEKQHNTI